MFANANERLQSHGVQRSPGFVTRKLSGLVNWAERKNRLSSVHGNPTIYDTHVFPWVGELENGWTVIRGELAQLMMQRNAIASASDGAAPTPTVGEDRSWTTFVLSNYFSRSNDIIAQCPETWRLVQKVPGLVSAMFSVLEPGQRLPAHHGPYNGLLRLHLGLIVPEPREAVGIRIDGKVCHWEEGRALIFDDTFEHEARNESNSSRVVLFIDFEKPLKFPARFVNRRLLRSYLLSPFVREGSGIKGWWARRLYQKARTLRANKEQEPKLLQEAEIVNPADRPSRAVDRARAVSRGTSGSKMADNGPLDAARSVRPRHFPKRDTKPGDEKTASIAPDDFKNGWPYDKEKIH